VPDLAECDPGLSCVVGIIQSGRVCGTGVLVNPSLVVTAAHCLYYGKQTLRVLFAESLAPESITIKVAEAVSHPNYRFNSIAFDLAILVLKRRAPASAVAAKLCEPDIECWRHRALRFAGFGNNSTPRTAAQRRRILPARVLSISAANVWIDPAVSVPCHGDSGGPLLVRSAKGEILVGIESGGDPFCHSEGRFVRLDTTPGKFIRKMLAR
jgi:secreted trypsin-like serine protease